MKILQVMQRLPVFAGFSPNGLKIIRTVTRASSFDAGQEIVRAGAQTEWLHVLLSGEIEVSLPDAGTPFTVLSAPEVVGALGFLGAGAAQVTVKARTQVTALSLQKTAFVALQQKRPQACIKLQLNLMRLHASHATAAATPLLRAASL